MGGYGLTCRGPVFLVIVLPFCKGEVGVPRLAESIGVSPRAPSTKELCLLKDVSRAIRLSLWRGSCLCSK